MSKVKKIRACLTPVFFSSTIIFFIREVNNPITDRRDQTATEKVVEGCFRVPRQEEGKEQESGQAGIGTALIRL